MGFLRNMFATAGEVELLRQQLAFSEKEREKLVWKVDALESEVKSERKRFDKTQAVVMDFTMHKTQGIGKVEKIQTDLFPKDTPVVEQKFTPSEESAMEALARAQMNADKESGFEPYPFEKYLQGIKDDPTKYSGVLTN